MATFTIGKSTKMRLNALGGAQYAATHPTPTAPQNASGTLFYVVSRGFAGKLQGYKAGTSSGTLYAVFNTSAAAYNYIKANKLRLHAIVTELPAGIK